MTYPNKDLTAIDLFAGVGGMSLGFQETGFIIKGAFEIEPRNVAQYNVNFSGNHAHQCDLSKISGDKILSLSGLRNVDVVFGGPPCQGFSMGGRRDIQDPRNALIKHFGRIIGEIRPKYFVMENVSGLIMGHGNIFLSGFVRQMRQLGYEIVTPIMVLDAANFGVPQHRKRVIVYGYQRGMIPPNYPANNEYNADENNKGPSVWDAIKDLPNIDTISSLFDTDVYVGKLGSASTYALKLRQPRQNNHKMKANAITHLTGCQRTLHDIKIIKRFSKIKPGDRDPVSRFPRLSPLGKSTTIRAGTARDHGSHTAPRPIHPFQPRCITVREAARIHSFPDWFTFDSTRWHGFRQIGNSVPPLLARAVSQSVLTALIENCNILTNEEEENHGY